MTNDPNIFDYDSVETGYYDHIFRKGKGVQSKWHHLKFSYLRTRMGNYGSHLDVGCGPGTFIGSLDGDSNSTGIDLAQGQIEYAKSIYLTENHSFECVDSEAWPFSDSSFEVVTLIELIEHLTMEENFRLMQEVERVLKPGGRLFLTTPNYSSLWPLVELIVNKVSKVSYEDQHISRFKPSSLREFLDESLDFHDVSVDKFQFAAPFAAFLGWRFADFVREIEAPLLEKWFGMLLFAEARKSND